MKKIRVFSLIVIFVSLVILIYIKSTIVFSGVINNQIIDGGFNYYDNSFDKKYLGYIYIPSIDIRRVIVRGTGKDALDSGFVGMHDFSCDLSSSCLIILAGHNISSVFSKLHDININDFVYLSDGTFNRRFIVYDYKVIDDNDISYLYNRNNELLLITCDRKGKRFIVLLREDL